MSKKDEIVYEKTTLGQALFNIYRKHGSKPSFFKNVKKGDKIGLEIEREWERLEKKKVR
jgi:hypothetical protein